MIRVFDNLISESNQSVLLAFLKAQPWAYGAFSDQSPGASRYLYRHYAGHFTDKESRQAEETLSELAQFPMIAQLWDGLQRTHIQGHVLMRCYATAYPVGSEGGLHRDSLEPEHYTAIYYPHLNWHPNYAGETVFFNDDATDIIGTVYPRPNRMVLFSGSIPHVARGVSRTCPELRITLMFKTRGPAAA